MAGDEKLLAVDGGRVLQVSDSGKLTRADRDDSGDILSPGEGAVADRDVVEAVEVHVEPGVHADADVRARAGDVRAQEQEKKACFFHGGGLSF